MNDNDWQREPPPLEAYSGVANPEAFSPLHARRLVQHHLTLIVLVAPLALVRLNARDEFPGWTADARSFLSITRTSQELSIVADAVAVPVHVQAARGYRALRIEGPLPLDLVGVLAAVAGPLAAAGIPIFAIATFDTDYVLVRERELAQVVAILTAAGHAVQREGSAAPADAPARTIHRGGHDAL